MIGKVTGILILFVFSFENTESYKQCSESTKTFVCDNYNETIVNIDGFKVACPVGRVCNKDYMIESRFRDLCNPCVDIKFCFDNKFKCVREKFIVTLAQQEIAYECPQYKTCNNEVKKTTCKPCVPKKCTNVDNWYCDPQRPWEVIIGGTVKKCQYAGEICNANYIEPCTPCINEKWTQ